MTQFPDGAFGRPVMPVPPEGGLLGVPSDVDEPAPSEVPGEAPTDPMSAETPSEEEIAQDEQEALEVARRAANLPPGSL